MLSKLNIGFIGGGNLARALIGGLRKIGHPAEKIIVSNRGKEKLLQLNQDFQVKITESNVTAANQADIIVLAVKPSDIQKVTREVSAASHGKLIVSLAAAVSISSLQQWLSPFCAGIVRCMTNTPALIGKGATGLFARHEVTTEQREITATLLQAVGQIVWVKSEDELDSLMTLVSCGPAFFFHLMDAMQQAAEKMGVDATISRAMVIQTALGATYLAQEKIAHGVSFTDLRAQVATRGGVTERGLKILEAASLPRTFYGAMFAAKQRGNELERALAAQQEQAAKCAL